MIIIHSLLALAIPIFAWFVMGLVLDYVCPRQYPPEAGIK